MGETLSLESAPPQPPPQAPQEGVTVEVQCGHTGQTVVVSEWRDQLITGSWTASQLQVAIEGRTGVHRRCQHLLFAGRGIHGSTTLERAVGCDLRQLPGRRVRVHLHVDRTHFPQRLGPFDVCNVPIPPHEFELPKIFEESKKNGFYWQLDPASLTGTGVMGPDKRLSGQVSPLHDLSFNHRCLANVPEEASVFAWSYPVEGWDTLEMDPYNLDSWEDIGEKSLAIKSFFACGGFMYLDHEDNVVGLATPLLSEGHGGSSSDVGGDFGGSEPSLKPEGCPQLRFGSPQPWSNSWTLTLAGQGRFQKCTVGALREMGAEWFMWLRPDEVICGLDGRPLAKQPTVPHGGFVFLFHRNLLVDEPDAALDRYFAVADLASTAVPFGKASSKLSRQGSESAYCGATPTTLSTATTAADYHQHHHNRRRGRSRSPLPTNSTPTPPPTETCGSPMSSFSDDWFYT